jgi:hypothetical protein
MSATRGFVYKFKKMQVTRLTAGGIPVGQANPSALVNDTVSSAYAINGIISAELGAPAREEYSFFGDASYKGGATGGIRDFPAFNISSASFDAALEVLCMGGAVDTAWIANVAISGLNISNPTPNDVGILLATDIQSADSATAGTTYTLNVWMVGTMTPVPQSLNSTAGENPIPQTYSFKPRLFTRAPDGTTVAAMGTNQSNDEDVMLRYVSVHPFSITTFVQDASETTFVTGYRPIYSNVNGTNNKYSTNGTAVTPTSHDTTTALVTLGAAGTAAQLSVAFYQTAFVAP